MNASYHVDGTEKSKDSKTCLKLKFKKKTSIRKPRTWKFFWEVTQEAIERKRNIWEEFE
jgi:hypothetical protein